MTHINASLSHVEHAAIPAVVFRADDLVLSVSHSATDGYEILVEIDTTAHDTVVPVEIGTAGPEEVRWLL